MKKLIILIFMCFCCFTLLPTKSSAIKINLRGKAGAQYINGKWKVCPGRSSNKCATIDVSWKEIKDYIFGSANAPVGTVEVFDEEGNHDYSISVKVVMINNSVICGTSPPNYIMGDDIELEQN